MNQKREQSRLKPGDKVEAEVFKITSFGAFVKLDDGQRALIHISQVADNFVKNIGDHLKLGDRIAARVLSIDGNKIDLTLKKPKDDSISSSSYPQGKGFRSSSFEDKLDRFLTKSEEKISELRKNTEEKQR